jgi:G:T-mismatch repair DNA endonuclease (very short patch repair protein)
MTDDPFDLVEQLQREGFARLQARRRAKASAPRAAQPPAAKGRARGTPEMAAQDAIVHLVRRHATRCRIAAVRNHTTPPPGLTDEQRIRFFARLKRGGLWSGHPDLIVYMPGARIELWETKAARGRLSDDQRKVHAELREMGFVVRVVLDVTQAEAALRSLGMLDNQRPPVRP